MRSGRFRAYVGIALAAGLGAATADADEFAAGERLFRAQCMGCHAVEAGRHRAGPTLHGVFGREAGSIPGFDFSEAMLEADIVWTSETLDAFLADPQAMVPGTKMVFWGLESEPRKQLIRYLEAATE